MMHTGLTDLLAMRAGPLEFGDPVWLVALLLLAPILYWWKTTRVPASRFRRWVSLLLRVSLVAAIVLALADTRMVWFNKGICVAFVVDQSQSVPGDARNKVRDLIKSEIDKMTKDDQFVIVEFGGDSVLAALPSPRGDVPAPVKVADTGHTNVARALRLAMASFPADRQKRIVLFSDGNQNQEDALREARIAGVKDVDIDVVPILAQRGREVMVDQLVVPPHVRKDARFLLRALVTSDTTQDVEVLVSRDGAAAAHLTDQHLKPGSNVIDVPDMLSDGGAHQYQLTIVPKNTDNDTFAANNTGYALTQVDAPGKVLLVPGKSHEPTYLYNALRAAGVDVVKTAAGGLPASTDELAGYDCVIMDNVNYADVNSRPQMSALKHWVEDYGGGLVLIGGDDSFGPGGYTNTELEELSPLSMDVKRQKHLASLAVAVILDKSGSMSMPVDAAGRIPKMQLANEGACEVAKLLDDQDMAMLGVCDTAVRWVDDYTRVIPMTARNKNKLMTGIRAVRAGGGGIDCATALTHAYDMVRTANTMSKHVIMFGDAQDCDQQEGCVQMARDMYAKFGITTSVMGMGIEKDIHARFEHDVADAGHGRCFITEDVKNLPRLFMKDAFLVSRQAFIEDANGIKLTPYNSPLLQGFLSQGQASLPSIYGYIGTTLKPRATLALHGKQADDPVLAHWVIGLGKCVAFTTDSSARWGKDWVSWDGYSKFWSQVVRWVSRMPQNNGLTTTTQIEGSDGRVVVDAVDGEGKPINNLQLQASVIAPNQASSSGSVPLEQIAPGRYQGRFAANQRGTYLVAVAEGSSGQPQLVATGGGVLSYPPEFRDLQTNVALLKNLAEASGGAYLTDIRDIFQQKPNPVHSFWPLWQVLLLLVTSSLFVDIAWRRLNVADWFRQRATGPAVQRTDASLGALRTIKTGRREVDLQRKSLRERVENAAEAPAEASTVATIAQPVAGAFPVAEARPAPTTPEATTAPVENYAHRLMNAKKRAKEQIREQSEDSRR
jgi:uncharacterized membrane protein